MSAHDPIPAPNAHRCVLATFRGHLTSAREVEALGDDANQGELSEAYDNVVQSLAEMMAVPASSASQLAEKLHSALMWHASGDVPRDIVEHPPCATERTAHMSQIDVLPFKGAFLIHKSTAPRVRHDSFTAAETEACRLLAADPSATFIISREQARVQVRRSSPGMPITKRK